MRVESAEEIQRRVAEKLREPSDATASTGENVLTWEMPLPLEEALPAAPEFPLHALPPEVRAYVLEASQALGAPPDMVAMPLLAGIGAMVGDRVKLRLQKGDGYSAFGGLWVAIIAEPGTGKTEAVKAGIKPLRLLQHDAIAAHQTLKLQWEQDLEAWEAKPKGERGEKPVRPQERSYTTSDATLEALTGLLSVNSGVAVVADELAGWIASHDQYRGGKGADREHFTSIWSNETVQVHRLGRDTVFVPDPVVSVIGGIQPDRLRELRNRSGASDGFVDRFILIRHDLRPSRWRDEGLSNKTLAPLVELVRKLDALPAIARPAMEADRAAVHLTPDADPKWGEWFDRNAEIIEHTDGLLRGSYLKLPMQLGRIALVLHLLWNPDDPLRMLSRDELLLAIEVVEFVRIHLQRSLGLVTGSHRREVASKVMDAILELNRDLERKGPITKREIQRRVDRRQEFMGEGASKRLDDVLDHLEECGWILCSRSGRSVQITVNPKVLERGETSTMVSDVDLEVLPWGQWGHEDNGTESPETAREFTSLEAGTSRGQCGDNGLEHLNVPTVSPQRPRTRMGENPRNGGIPAVDVPMSPMSPSTEAVPCEELL